jgi:hypothetical protein
MSVQDKKQNFNMDGQDGQDKSVIENYRFKISNFKSSVLLFHPVHPVHPC